LTKPLQLNPKWFNGIEDQATIDEVGARLKENSDLFLILARIVNQKLESNSKSRRSKCAYDKPAFSEFQADCNGYERALEEVLTYLKIRKETE